MSKQRLDVLLVSRNLVESRELAQRLIIAGEVSVGGHPSTKPGLKVNEDADIAIRNRPRYVSRGGLKMEGALNAFPVSAEGKVCLDIGASTVALRTVCFSTELPGCTRSTSAPTSSSGNCGRTPVSS